MADSDKVTIYCGPCEYEDTTKFASKWCSDCEEGYCDECLRVHKAAKMSRHHHLIAVTEYQKVEQLAILQVCQVHQKVFEYFCPGHDSLICILCVKSEHSTCPDPLSLQNAAKGAKTSTALSNLEQNIDNLLDNIENGIKIQDKNLSDILESEESIKNETKARHREIIQFFERLLEKTLTEVTIQFRECQKEISSSKSTLIKKQTQIRNVKDRLLQMKTCLSDVQSFIGVKMMAGGGLDEEKLAVNSLITHLPLCSLEFEPNLTIKTSIENIKTYGTTIMATTKGCASFVEPNVEQAQLNSMTVNSVDSIELQLRTRINLKCKPCIITSCLILQDKQIMILDKTKKRLMIYNEKGSHDRDIAVNLEPYDATIINHHTIAVTFFDHKNIAIVDTKSDRILRDIETGVKKSCWGISHDNGKLYIVSYGEGIHVLDLHGRIIKKIKVDVDKVSHLVNNFGNIICSDHLGKHISLGAAKGQTWHYSSDKLSHHKGFSASITTDQKGNVYAVGDQFNVLLIAVSKDCNTDLGNVTGRDYYLEHPKAVYYSENHKLVLICNRENGQAALYDVRF
ncbi:uncharacterized protein LOC134697632 [Mytilus trossulus]|uniref:uncharacterized protein LOC134697632 n=1 Tax=Mytilus trossulus TaxID=6551 RepID=UPI0030077F42